MYLLTGPQKDLVIAPPRIPANVCFISRALSCLINCLVLHLNLLDWHASWRHMQRCCRISEVIAAFQTEQQLSCISMSRDALVLQLTVWSQCHASLPDHTVVDHPIWMGSFALVQVISTALPFDIYAWAADPSHLANILSLSTICCIAAGKHRLLLYAAQTL